jgi:purine-binding chemotaxis protein CheW
VTRSSQESARRRAAEFGGASSAVGVRAEEEPLQLVTLGLADEEYGIPIKAVQEIIRIRNIKITAIPNAPRFIEGVINLRGRMIPIVDLRTRFGMETAERDRANRIVVINVGERTIGVVVDSVIEVVRVLRSEIEELPDLAVGVDSDYIQGVCRVGDRMVIVLDIGEMFSADENSSIDELA